MSCESWGNCDGEKLDAEEAIVLREDWIDMGKVEGLRLGPEVGVKVMEDMTCELSGRLGCWATRCRKASRKGGCSALLMPWSKEWGEDVCEACDTIGVFLRV